jgi:hypothetical protein
VGALLLPLVACAGPTFGQALGRHHALLDAAAARDDAFALLAPPSEGLMPVIGGPEADVPHLLEPTLRGRGGARVVASVAGERQSARLRLGVSWREDTSRDLVLDGTALSIAVRTGSLYASVEPRHWGPGWVGSLILDAAAPPVPAVGWRKTAPSAFDTPWLAWLGPWNADVFIGQLEGHTQPAHPYLIGMRVQLRPLRGLEIGASRTMQWAGAGRDRSLRTLWNSLIGRDNDSSAGEEPGNQLAGFDLRYTVALGVGHLGLYGQAIGEDEAGLMPSQWMAQIGADWAVRFGARSLRVFVEGADLVAGDISGHPRPGSAYRNHIYRQGYTNDGLPLGHPVGGDAKLASVGALLDAGRAAALLMLHGGRATDASQRFTPGASLAGLNAAASLELDRANRIGLALWLWRAGGERSTALQAWWQTAWR